MGPAERGAHGARWTDQRRLSPPGFGAPVPEGWTADVYGYRDWLVAELKIGHPVDLVGHDWGGGHVLNVAMIRPDLMRTWCSDVVGIYDPEYVWHSLAQIWQTPGEGEAAVEARLATPVDEAAAGLASQGMDPAVAERVAAGFDADMGRCILTPYRSASHEVLVGLGAQLEAAAARPGLVPIATEDHFVATYEQRRRTAARAGARVEVLEGLGHWWMTQDPGRGAPMLTSESGIGQDPRATFVRLSGDPGAHARPARIVAIRTRRADRPVSRRRAP